MTMPSTHQQPHLPPKEVQLNVFGRTFFVNVRNTDGSVHGGYTRVHSALKDLSVFGYSEEHALSNMRQALTSMLHAESLLATS